MHEHLKITDQPELSTHEEIADQVEQLVATKRTSQRKPETKRLFPIEEYSYEKKRKKKKKEKDSAVIPASMKVIDIQPYREPNHYRDAISSPEAEMWINPIEEEYKSLVKNETWELAQLPDGGLVIKTRWIFKKKVGINGD